MEKDMQYKPHRKHGNLTGEHPWGDMGQIILFLMFLVVWVVDSFIFHFSTFLASFVSIYFRLPIALGILSGAVYFIRSGHRIIFDEIRKQPRVIRSGVFRRVRHPLYLGSLLFYPGLIVLTLSISSFVVWLGIIAFYHFISRYEEKLLLYKFDDEYARYMSEVPMWMPRLKLGS